MKYNKKKKTIVTKEIGKVPKTIKPVKLDSKSLKKMADEGITIGQFKKRMGLK